MPTLADIYSAINTAKRKGSDFLQNPGTSLQQMLGDANDRARAFNQATANATASTLQSGSFNNPESMALASQIAEGYNPAGMTVFHGSPHVFEKFDISKLGTGEGAQAYGSGLYMAQSPNVAKEYQTNLSGYKASGANRVLGGAGGDIEAALIEAQRKIDHYQNVISQGGGGDLPRAQRFLEMSNKQLNDLQSMKSGQPENMGAFYKVDLPDTHIRRMLDWDAPIKEQPAPVRKLAKSLGIDLNDLGGDLLAQVGKDEAGRQVLEKAGIRGIKYLDEKSRWSPYQVDLSVKGKPYASSQFATKEQAQNYASQKQGEGFKTNHKMVGTRNFVVFDPTHLNILERNSEPIQ